MAAPPGTTAPGVHVRNLDERHFDGLQRVLTVSRSCTAPNAVQVRFKVGELRRQQVRLLMIDRAGRLLRSSARLPSMTDAGPGSDGSVPSYGLRDTWTLRQVAGPAITAGESSGWRVVLVTADSTKALAHPNAVVVPSCRDGVWHAPTPTLEVTDVRRDCAAKPPTDGYFTAHVRAVGLVYGQIYAIDGGASGNDLNNVPRTMAESYDGDMTFTPGIDRRPSPNGVAKPFPRTAFTVTLQIGPERVVRKALAVQPPMWFEARDETSDAVTVAVPGC
ncbi:hypothetical protein ASD06_02105 [Angustibacter sp. Root456]|nr:hypothetical protein ASD06_02105 [Angustibacter sp. Root456]